MSKADGGLTTMALAYLALCPDIWAERRNSGKIMKGSRRILLGEPGTPDITGLVFKKGWPCPFGIETKALDGKMREAQLEWRKKAESWGVAYCEARSLSDVKDFVAYLRGLQ